MPATRPQTRKVADAIVSYLTALTYADTTHVYGLAQLEVIMDVVSRVSDGGAVAEVYGGADDSARHNFGGRIWDEQEWYILSMCSLETSALAANIYDVRDALVQPFQEHAKLGAQVDNLFHAQIKDKSGMFLQVVRNGQRVKAHMIQIMTRQEWVVPTPPGIIS